METPPRRGIADAVRRQLRTEAAAGNQAAVALMNALGGEFAAAERHDRTQELFGRLTRRIAQSTLPRAVECVPCPLPVRGFFPGASGFWPEASTHAQPPLMILAHDFGTVQDYAYTKEADREDPNEPTWRELLALLKAARISATDCFFTNAVIALRKGSRNWGGSPGLNGAATMRLWRDCLTTQLEVVRPKGIVVLGKPAWRIVSGMDATLPQTFTAFDRLGDMVHGEIGGVRYR